MVFSDQSKKKAPATHTGQQLQPLWHRFFNHSGSIRDTVIIKTVCVYVCVH